MSRKSIIELLLAGYIEDRLSPGEKNHFFELLAADGNEDLFREILTEKIHAMSEPYNESAKAPDFSGIFKKISQEIDIREQKKARLLSVRRRLLARRLVAAVSAAAAVFALAFFIGRLSVQIPETPAEIPLSMSEIKAPLGSRSEIKLPDGTTVILNAGSQLTYGNSFNYSDRNVKMSGEAYFKVERNESLPFIVNAGPLNITALGTEFNVKAYDDDNSIETTLVTGKVAITREGSDDGSGYVDLNPNQKAIFIRQDDGFILEDVEETVKKSIKPVQAIMPEILIAPHVNTDQVLAWTQGRLILKGESLNRLCVQLERKYDVTIVFKKESIKNFRFTGVLLDETLEQVLNVIKLAAPISYSLEGKTVYLDLDSNSLNDFSKYIK